VARGKSFPLEVSNLGKRVVEGSDSPPTALDGGLDKNLNMPSLPRLEVQAEGQRDEPVHAYAPASQRIDRSITRLARRRAAGLGAVIALFAATGAAASPTSRRAPHWTRDGLSCRTAGTKVGRHCGGGERRPPRPQYSSHEELYSCTPPWLLAIGLCCDGFMYIRLYASGSALHSYCSLSRR
jgi:hypothetical protein